jgi:hypothetical protein
MADKKEIIGYFTDDRNIHCIECINKNREIRVSLRGHIFISHKI